MKPKTYGSISLPVPRIAMTDEQKAEFTKQCLTHAYQLNQRWLRALLSGNDQLKEYLYFRVTCFERLMKPQFVSDYIFPTSRPYCATWARANHSAHNAVYRIARRVISRTALAAPC